jgi:hypothetical protein
MTFVARWNAWAEQRSLQSQSTPERAMNQPVQSMTLQELRDELHRTSQAWETLDLDGVLADGELAAMSEDAHRHQMVANELLRRPSEGSPPLLLSPRSWSSRR